ncbi:hypothetical protein MATL_G00077310 [Megalops atlanticus]|uniref:Endonuclease/exonuclease/phosphatase domain-containing protein n=1 Tax=Megalops atlanticus TaxID=7932 RepID=A0A9D3Q9Z6_MEGAT|nr:hypothetical protein MATL_G00077310 [Megalops atlanticus]
MERAVVRCVPWESKLTISFILDGSQKHMLRDQTEELGKVLARIANNALKGQGKAKKSKKNKAEQTAAVEPDVRLYYNGDFVAEDALNHDAWQDGAVLHVGDSKYKVERNPPSFTVAELPVSLLASFPEVDKGVFVDSLSPALDAFDMDGVFRIKEKQHEGLATYFRRSKFKLLSQHDIVLSEALVSDPLHSELLDKLSTNPVLKEKVVQRSTALQVTVLQSLKEASKKLCVANTHLYWHPKGGHIRLIQMAVALKHLSRLTSEEYPGVPLIFSGDFNSTPSSGLFQLASQGAVPESHADWASDGPDELCPMAISNPFQLISACGEPAYTNYVGGFHGCLDYIFLEPHAHQVEQVISLPSHQEVTTYQALPSVAHPSDHIALVCDLTWK